MDTRRVKNCIILVLLLLNAFLLVITISDIAGDRAAAARESQELLRYITGAGITVRAEEKLNQKPLNIVSLFRDLDKESLAVASLLKNTSSEYLGGNIYRYYGDKGEATFRGTGAFDILFRGTGLPLKGSKEKTARSVMDKLGIKTDPAYCVTTETAANAETVTLRCMWEGVPVFDRTIDFTFMGDYLLLVSGTRILDDRLKTTAETGFSLSTATAKFIGEVRASGKICSEITDIAAGYETSAALSGDSSLIPVWRFITDAGEYTIR
jgi:hypothetical protein